MYLIIEIHDSDLLSVAKFDDLDSAVDDYDDKQVKNGATPMQPKHLVHEYKGTIKVALKDYYSLHLIEL
jgi:hypothetical protein